MAEILHPVRLGHSGIEVSPLCLGGMSFGEPSPKFHQWTIGPKETEEVIGYAFDNGINFIDSANGYAFGTSEEYIGKAIKNLHIPREQLVLASKVYFNEGHLSRKAITREIEGTLHRLGTDYLDLYIIHRFDYDTPIEETLETLDSLVKAGKVRALGASEMYAYQLHNMQICAEQHGWTKFTSMQCHYNLLYRENEREMIPVCRQFDMAITPYSLVLLGILSPSAQLPIRLCTVNTIAIEKPICQLFPALLSWQKSMGCRWHKLLLPGIGHAASKRPLLVVQNQLA